MTFDPFVAARWIDVLLVIAAAPFVLLMGLPVLGYVVGAASWVLSRVIGHVVERRAKASENIRTEVGVTLFSSLGRAWLVAVAVLVVGVAGARADGLTAAVLMLVAFTVHLVSSIALRPLQRQPSRS